ncbi:MAG: LysR family transcriptional regulator [Gammaproteobacteria bacterium]|nr:LysR family transcriptional regulator [Gammaproteobacteria bacterium]MBU1440215.1 LysR family transcriptional regulator [Gammaproteobacteria bacterium]MBU2287977.1 LysR family transcriptional regulator [Gammaproteobacteria bacterium]MBU2411032.1 LysR family transcriptional regulator [Gammaproteobacteria bacterium]
MEVFVRVAECGSFSRAAESLDLANATVTTCVRNLERHLDVTLINRDTRRLRLTEEGQMFLLRARDLLESVARTEEEIRSQVGQLRGRLHIETPISLGHALLCPALPDFAKRYPEISTAVTLSNQPHHVIERGIDVAIRMDQVEDADLIARPIYEGSYIVCCAPDLVGTLPAHPDELDRRRCIGILPEERRFVNPWLLRKGEERVEIRPDGPLHFNSSDALLMAAQRGAGVTCVLDVFVNSQLADGTLVQVYPEWETAVKTFYVVMAQSRVGSAKVKAFTDFLFDVFATQRRPSGHSVVGVRPIGKR